MARMRNLLLDPKPASAAKWTSKSSEYLSVKRFDDDRLMLNTLKDGSDLYAFTRMTVPAGTYRFGAEISYPQGGYAKNALRFIKLNPIQELLNAEWAGTAGRYVTGANVLGAETQIELRVMCASTAGAAVWYRHLFLMTEADYQHMHDELSVDWFCGDSYTVMGGGLALLALTVIHIGWWSHEPPIRGQWRDRAWLRELHAVSHSVAARVGSRGDSTPVGRDGSHGGHSALPVCTGGNVEHGDAAATVRVRRDKRRCIRVDAGTGARWRAHRHDAVGGTLLRDRIQRDERSVHDHTAGVHAQQRNGRIRDNQQVQPILSELNHASRWEVAA